MSLFGRKNIFSQFDEKFSQINNKEKKLKEKTISCPYCCEKIKKSNNGRYICNPCNREIYYIKEKKQNNNCKYCGENTIIMDSGKYICGKCGREHGYVISKHQEWRFSLYDKGSVNNARCSVVQNPLLPTVSFRIINILATGRVILVLNTHIFFFSFLQQLYKMKKCWPILIIHFIYNIIIYNKI